MSDGNAIDIRFDSRCHNDWTRMRKPTTKITAMLAAALVSACLLGGCSSGGSADASAVADAQNANRAYMSAVNEAMLQLDDDLTDFSSAVSAGDLVAMRTASTAASRTIDTLEAIEAPEALADIQQLYTQGATTLEGALASYVQLYTDVEIAGQGGFDAATFQARLAEVQQAYDEGIDLLSQADEQAAGME